MMYYLAYTYNLLAYVRSKPQPVGLYSIVYRVQRRILSRSNPCICYQMIDLVLAKFCQIPLDFMEILHIFHTYSTAIQTIFYITSGYTPICFKYVFQIACSSTFTQTSNKKVAISSARHLDEMPVCTTFVFAKSSLRSLPLETSHVLCSIFKIEYIFIQLYAMY